MKKTVKIISVLLCIVIAISSCMVSAFAKVEAGNIQKPEETQTSAAEEPFDSQKVAVKIIADKGDWSQVPENSKGSIMCCSSKYISVDIQLTSDGVPVLMEDETVERMCVTADNKAVSGKVRVYKSEEITKLFLRNRNGGPHNSITNENVAKLSDVLEISNDKILILDFKIGDLDAVYKTVYDADASKRVIFRIDGNTKDVISALSKKDSVPETIVTYNGNIIFSVNSTIKKAHKSGIELVQLGTKNQSGVIFYNSVSKKLKKNSVNAVFSMTDGFNGKREDNVTGWDDIISHGYLYIETNYPDLLSDYVSDSETIRERLFSLLLKETEYENGKYPRNLKKDYDKALKYAKEVSKSTASKSMLMKAYTDLDNAMNQLNISEGSNTSSAVFTVTPAKIVIAVLCLGAVVAAQIYFIKRRKKTEK